MMRVPTIPVIDDWSNFECLKRFDAAVRDIGQRLGEYEWIGLDTDWSHSIETQLTYRVGLSFEYVEYNDRKHLMTIVQSTLLSCFAVNSPVPKIVLNEMPPGDDYLRAFLVSVRISHGIMQSVSQQRSIIHVFQMVGPNLLIPFVQTAYHWTLEHIHEIGMGEYTDMSTQDLKRFARFKKIHEYLVFKNNLDQEEVATTLLKQDDCYKWVFYVPRAKRLFAHRVLVPEVRSLWDGEAYSFEFIPPLDDTDTADFVFRIDKEVLEDLWCNNSIAAVYDVLGKFLTNGLLSNVDALPDAETIVQNHHKLRAY